MSKSKQASPNDGRFRKGISGNKSGRPKAVPTPRCSDFGVMINRTLSVTQNGKKREVSLAEALEHKICQCALAGDYAAQREMAQMIMEREKWLAAHEPTVPAGGVTVEDDPQNANTALLHLGIAAVDTRWEIGYPNGVVLLPWAVQAAISRPGRRRLSDEDVSAIKLCTRDVHTLRWPKGRKNG